MISGRDQNQTEEGPIGRSPAEGTEAAEDQRNRGRRSGRGETGERSLSEGDGRDAENRR